VVFEGTLSRLLIAAVLIASTAGVYKAVTAFILARAQIGRAHV
jgi:hypothetical protein